MCTFKASSVCMLNATRMVNKLLLLLIIVVGCARPDNGYSINLDSNGEDGTWNFENSNKSISAKAIVPGGIYTDLMRNGIINDIFIQNNDVLTRWVAKDTWKYNRKFTLPSDVLKKNVVKLIFEGLDTVSNITLNDHLIGSSDNMFVKYSFDIKHLLKEGENNIEVQFYSPIAKANELSQKEMIPPACVPNVYNGECHVNQLRKMQASFSWDWGPAFPSVGIWKSVSLEAYDSAIINYVTSHLILNETDSTWYVTVKIYMETTMNNLQGHLTATLETDNNASITVYKYVEKISEKNNQIEMLLTVNEALVQLWWPNGYGKQKLYNLKITFQSTEYAESVYKNIKIGFRTIELIQDPIDSDGKEGLTFYFKVNQKPIFMKGTNWIPLHILPELSYTKEKVDYLLMSAKYIHTNMMRVWGGGMYESDYFYEKCDELGILIWQDFMFACNMYPVNNDFIRSVSQEIEQAVLRLQYHPSIALWAGNNENEVALRGNWYGTGHNFEHYKSEYKKLYVDTMRPVVLKNDPTRTFVVSSPSNGIQSEKEDYIAQNPYDPHYGDTHYYNYIQDLWSMDTYPKARFSSEYGFQAIPSIDTLKTATDDLGDLNIDSKFMKHRQHSPLGYQYIFLQIKTHLILPDNDDTQYFNTLIYYSQITQALAMKTETEFYRQSQLNWMTMGALYWQLNDVWQAPSWSSIEFTGRWKMLHYYARDFFSPILISPRLLAMDNIVVFVINDRLQPIMNATVIIEKFEWNSMSPTLITTYCTDVKGLSVKEIDIKIKLPTNKEEWAKTFYRFSLKNENLDYISPFNYIFPVHLKNIIGYNNNPNIQIQIIGEKSLANNRVQYDISLKTDSIVLFVWLEIPYTLGQFSDNGFTLTEIHKNVTFFANEHINHDDLLKILKVLVYKNAYMGM